MRKVLILCLSTACVMSTAIQARSLDQMVEPAMMMNLHFGGNSRPEFGMGLRLNYSTAVRQVLGTLSLNPDTSLEAFENGIGSHLLQTPALAQLDFNRHGFRRASLAGLPLVTRHVRLNQAEEAAGEEVPVDEGAVEEGAVQEEGVVQQETTTDVGVAEDAAPEEIPAEEIAEDAAWYDYSQWGWKGWSLAAAGVVGAYLLVDGGSDDPAPASNSDSGGGGCPPGQVPNPVGTPPCIDPP